MAARDNFLEEVTNYCLLGATDKELGAFFGISEHQVQSWAGFKDDGYIIQDFADAVNAGRDMADARIARAMFKRAEGYDITSNRVIITKGHAQVIEVTEHVPPDTQAGKFWLTNRAKRKWKDRQQLSHVGADGEGPVQTEMTITFVAPGTQPAIAPPDGRDVIEGTAKVVTSEPTNDEH